QADLEEHHDPFGHAQCGQRIEIADDTDRLHALRRLVDWRFVAYPDLDELVVRDWLLVCREWVIFRLIIFAPQPTLIPARRGTGGPWLHDTRFLAGADLFA